MKKRIVAIVLLLAVAGAGAYAAYWYRDQTEDKGFLGSASSEFDSVAAPGTTKRPKREVRRLPWPQYGYDAARTHFAPEFRHRPPYRMLWRVDTKKYMEFPPAVADDRVFVANQNGDVIAIRAKTGKVAWRQRYRRCLASGPAVSGGTVFVSVMNPIPCERTNRTAQPGFVVALAARTGRVRWRFNTSAVESSPLVVGRNVYVASWNHRIYALNARSGSVRWSYDTGEEINSSAAYADGTIFIGSDGGHVYALNAWTGRLKWRASAFSRFGRREDFYATPAVAYGRVYIGNTDGTLYAFGAKSGDLLWAQRAGTYVYTAAAVWDGRVYVGSYDGGFSAFDAGTGKRVWRWEAPGAIHGAPTVMAGLVYFSTTSAGIATAKAQRYIKPGRRGTYALDARTGKLVWQRRGRGQYSPIVADEERVYLVGSTAVFGLEPKRKAKAERQGGTKSKRNAKRKRKGDGRG